MVNWILMLTETNSTNNTRDVVETLAPAIIQTAHEHGEIVTILAIIGVFAILGSISRIMMPILEVLAMLFVITPLIMIRSLTTKTKRRTLRSELGEIKEYSVKNPNVIAGFILYIIGIVVFCIVVTIVSIRLGI